jgi:hypothetical protein
MSNEPDSQFHRVRVRERQTAINPIKKKTDNLFANSILV